MVVHALGLARAGGLHNRAGDSRVRFVVVEKQTIQKISKGELCFWYFSCAKNPGFGRFSHK